MPFWMERLQSTVRNGRRTSTNSCSSPDVGRGSSSHDVGGVSRMILRSSAEVTGVTVDRLKAAGGKTGGGEPSVSFRMLNTLAVMFLNFDSTFSLVLSLPVMFLN